MKKKNLELALRLKKKTISNLMKMETIVGASGSLCDVASCPNECVLPNHTEDQGTQCKCF